MPVPRDIDERNHRHRHNGLLGHIAIDIQHMKAVLNSPSVTHQGKRMASIILDCLRDLDTELRQNRVELDGTVVHPQARN